MKIFPAVGLLICSCVTVAAQSGEKEVEVPVVKKLMVIIDGITVDAVVTRIIDPGKIESVSVLKSNMATAIYGPAAADGAIIIRSREEAAKVKVLAGKASDVGRAQGKNTEAAKPIIVIDGAVSDRAMLDNLSLFPKEIVSISMLKHDASTAIYGPAAVDGVIVVETIHKK